MQWIQCVAMSRIYLMIIYVSNGSDWPRYSGAAVLRVGVLVVFGFVYLLMCAFFSYGALQSSGGEPPLAVLDAVACPAAGKAPRSIILPAPRHLHPSHMC